MDHTTEHILPEHPVKNVGGHKPWPSACRVWPPEHPVKNVGGHKRRLVRAPSVWNQLATPVKNVGYHKRRLVLAISGILAIVPTAGAGLPDTEAFNGLHEVSDAELGDMRGKFAGNNQVMYFGVEMVSQWQTPEGNLVTAGANLNIDFRDGNTPTVQFVPTVTIVSNGAPAGQSGNTNEVSGGAGLANVSGVTQSIQVAGQSNRIRNDIDMQVNLTSATQGGGSISGAVQGQAGTFSDTLDGTVATVALENNSIGVGVTVPGQGQVLQQIRNNGMMQTVQIGGDQNVIHNQITMNIGLNTVTDLNSAGVAAALQGLHGIQQPGMF